MILSIISNIEIGLIKSNKIFITPELVGVFKNIWSNIVDSERHHCIFAMPFYHLRTEPFWELIPKKGFENTVQSKIVMKSFSNLQSAISYAILDPELFIFLSKKEEREIIKMAILDKYFSSSKNKYPKDNGTNHLNNLENEILNEPSEIYRSKILNLQNQLKDEGFEEEQFVRGGIFKRQVPIIYQNKCAISGLQINATFNVSLIDACHIVPFSNSYDDTITNGISLTPTLHRAFDRGLISIDDNYCVIVSDKFNENEIVSNYSISQFEGKKLYLPKEIKYFPSLENLNWHRSNVFK